MGSLLRHRTLDPRPRRRDLENAREAGATRKGAPRVHGAGNKLRTVRAAMAIALGALLATGPGHVAIAGVSDMQAYESHGECANLGPAVDSTSATTPLAGTRQWGLYLQTSVPAGVSNPTISVGTGYHASQFRMTGGGVPFCSDGTTPSSTPITFAQPSLAAGGCMCDGLHSTIPLRLAPGFDSGRSVSPQLIPRQGTQQTVTAFVELKDPALAGGLFKTAITSDVPGATVTSATCDPACNVIPMGNSVQFNGNFGLNQRTTVTATFNVPNPFGRPFRNKPSFAVIFGGGAASFDPGPTSTKTLAVPTLDGPTPGSGAVTYSISGFSGSWQLTSGPSFQLLYESTPLPCDPDQNGNSQSHCRGDGGPH